MITLYLGYDQYPSSMKAPALILLSGVLTYAYILIYHSIITLSQQVSQQFLLTDHFFTIYFKDILLLKGRHISLDIRRNDFIGNFFVRRFNLFLCASFSRVYFDINEVGKL